MFKASSQYGGQKGHMLTLVRQELHRLGFTDDQIDGGGLRVTTTLTPAAMAAAEDGVKEVRPDISDKELHVAAATVQPGTGALLGFFGGQNYLRSQINWAEAGGMVGSTFKPVSLAAAITDGYSLKSTWDGNSPYSFPDGLEVHNEGPSPGTSYGSAVSSVLRARAVDQHRVRRHVGQHEERDPTRSSPWPTRWGSRRPSRTRTTRACPSSTRDLEPDALITLGKARISAINMANTYATIANGGQRADVHVIDKVTLSDGTVKYQYKPHTTQADRPRHQLRRQLRDAAGRAARHRHQRPGGRSARRPARPVRRPTASTRSPRRGSSGSPRRCPRR